jgi:benzodiazapine receptor
MKRDELIKLVISLLICQLAGVMGSAFTSSSISTWYPTLIKPAYTLSGQIIGSVWIALFTLMGISLFIVWRKGRDKPGVNFALYIFAAQLIVNVLWSAAFFGLQSPLAGMIVIAILWVLILIAILRFWQINRTAALLLVPYILWVSFAAFLNYSIWRLNS